MLDTHRAIDIGHFNLKPSGDGLAGSLGFTMSKEAGDGNANAAPPLELNMAIEVSAGGQVHNLRVTSIKVLVNSTGLKGTIGVRAETEEDLQGSLRLEEGQPE